MQGENTIISSLKFSPQKKNSLSFKHALEKTSDDASEDQGNEIIRYIAHSNSIQNQKQLMMTSLWSLINKSDLDHCYDSYSRYLETLYPNGRTGTPSHMKSHAVLFYAVSILHKDISYSSAQNWWLL